MAPQQTHQRLGNHPDLCFRGEMEVKLSHSHHYLQEQNRMRGNHQQPICRKHTKTCLNAN